MPALDLYTMSINFETRVQVGVFAPSRNTQFAT